MVQMDINKVTGYILAGGKSSRMGTDKGLMNLGGKTLVQYVIDALKPVADKVVIVSNNAEYEKFGFEVIEDEIKGIGPAGGIYTALNHSTSEKNFIISCDMPFVTSDSINFVVVNAHDSEITLPIHNQNLEPLFGVYSKVCLQRWKTLIESGNIKLHDLVEHFRLNKLKVDYKKLFDDKIFMNVNDKHDFMNVIEYNNRKVH